MRISNCFVVLLVVAQGATCQDHEEAPQLAGEGDKQQVQVVRTRTPSRVRHINLDIIKDLLGGAHKLLPKLDGRKPSQEQDPEQTQAATSTTPRPQSNSTEDTASTEKRPPLLKVAALTDDYLKRVLSILFPNVANVLKEQQQQKQQQQQQPTALPTDGGKPGAQSRRLNEVADLENAVDGNLQRSRQFSTTTTTTTTGRPANENDDYGA